MSQLRARVPQSRFLEGRSLPIPDSKHSDQTPELRPHVEVTVFESKLGRRCVKNFVFLLTSYLMSKVNKFHSHDGPFPEKNYNFLTIT
jgi:hypothetical protein